MALEIAVQLRWANHANRKANRTCRKATNHVIAYHTYCIYVQGLWYLPTPSYTHTHTLSLSLSLSLSQLAILFIWKHLLTAREPLSARRLAVQQRRKRSLRLGFPGGEPGSLLWYLTYADRRALLTILTSCQPENAGRKPRASPRKT